MLLLAMLAGPVARPSASTQALPPANALSPGRRRLQPALRQFGKAIDRRQTTLFRGLDRTPAKSRTIKRVPAALSQEAAFTIYANGYSSITLSDQR